MPDPLEQLGAAIPSVYYDLIARVIPGLTLLGIGVLGCPHRDQLKAIFGRLDAAAAVLVCIAAGYLIGILVTPLGSLFEVPWILAARKTRATHKYGSDRLWIVIDAVEKKNASVGGTLAKMAAEVTLCQNIAAGSFALLFIPSVRTSFRLATIVTWLLLTVLSTLFRAFVLQRRAAVVAKEYGVE